MKTIVIFANLLFLVGCVTPYQQKGFRGGYSDFQMAEDVFNVEFSGNAFASKQTVLKYLLRRSSELTLESGYKYFVVLDSKDTSTITRSQHGSATTTGTSYIQGTANTNTSGNSGSTFFSATGNDQYRTSFSGYSEDIIKPGRQITIKCLKERPRDFPGLVIDAAFFLKENVPKDPKKSEWRSRPKKKSKVTP